MALASCGGGGGGGPPAPPTGPATVLLSGVAQFESVPSSPTTGALVYTGITAKPIRGATVEIVHIASGQVLASTQTDASGAYSALIPPADSVFIRVRAQLVRSGTPGWDFRVRDNTSANAPYALDSVPISGMASATVPAVIAGSGWDAASSSYAAPRAAGPFAVLDVVYEAHQKTLTVAPNQVFPQLNLFWSVNNRPACCTFDPAAGLIITTHFSVDGFSQPSIYILGQANTDTDEYDRHVVAHEFGHYLQWAVSRDNSVGGPHGLTDRLDMRVAFSEGWGNAWSGIVLNDPVYRDSGGPAQAFGFTFDVSTPLPPGQQPGWYKEDSLGFVIWEANRLLGFGTLWNALTGPVRATTAATSAHLLAHALKTVAPAEASTVTTIFSSQSIITNDEFGTGETNSGGIADALPIYKPYPAIGSPLQLCVTNAAGDPNKLGNYAFARVTLSDPRDYTIRLEGGTDPDFEIFNAAFSAQAISPDSGLEVLNVNLAAGLYVIAVTEFVLTSPRCLTLTIN